MTKKNKSLLKIFKKDEVKKVDHPADAIMKKVVDEWIAKKGHVLQKVTESNEERKKRKKAERKDILAGKLVVGDGAKLIFDLQFENKLTKTRLEKAKTKLEETNLSFTDAKSKLSRKGPRKRTSKEEKAFVDWVKKCNIDLKESLPKIIAKAEEAYETGLLKENISRSALADYLKIYRPPKKVSPR